MERLKYCSWDQIIRLHLCKTDFSRFECRSKTFMSVVFSLSKARGVILLSAIMSSFNCCVHQF